MRDPDEERVVELLRRLGATDEEIAATPEPRSYGDLALELAVRSAPPLRPHEAAAAIGRTVDELRQVCHALGLPPLLDDAATVPAGLVETLPLLASGDVEWLEPEVALAMARVVGTTTARMAEALVDAYRVQVEVPRLNAGESYAEVVEHQIATADAGIRMFEAFALAVFRAHLVRVASSTWTPDEDGAATRRDLFVGFVDLVGYTALSRTMTTAALTRLLSEFEETVDPVVAAGDGRVVKLIGDSAMFVAGSAAAGCDIALRLCDALAQAEGLPPARIGGDVGSVLTRYGDYYGDVVNRAARLVAVARPGTVVVSDAVRQVADGFEFEALPAQALKGFQGPAVSFRLLSR